MPNLSTKLHADEERWTINLFSFELDLDFPLRYWKCLYE